jgi:hypothetical protein
MTTDQLLLIAVAGIAAMATLGAAIGSALIQATAAIIAAWLGKER